VRRGTPVCHELDTKRLSPEHAYSGLVKDIWTHRHRRSHTHTHTHIQREREREREKQTVREGGRDEGGEKGEREKGVKGREERSKRVKGSMGQRE
jgi:hypothetical protein